MEKESYKTDFLKYFEMKLTKQGTNADMGA